MKILDELLELFYPTKCAFCHKLTGGDKICKSCGREMKVITKDHKVREELAYIPAKLFVLSL